MDSKVTATRELLLRRQGLVWVEATGPVIPDDYVKAVEIKLAELGYTVSTRLRGCLERSSVGDLTILQDWLWKVLAAEVGADEEHKPLFRNFPNGIPRDTFDLWLQKVLCHFLQAEGQSCLFCRRVGTTHVLNACHHVVCNHCFDGSNYSACPVCEHHVDTSSPFFKPSPAQVRTLPVEKVRFKLLDLCESIDAEARALFVGFCERKQALSPADKDDLGILLRDCGEEVLTWLPASIPVRENIATVFGTLLQDCDPDVVLPAAKRYITTATDVLRFIAALSGADPSLQGETGFKSLERVEPPSRFWSKIAGLLGATPPEPRIREVMVPVHANRFKVAPLRRPLRRALLELLEGFRSDLLTEDMLRHRSYWIWLGEFLHPYEYRKSFPKVARAFEIIRKKAPDGTPAPDFQGYYAKFEAAVGRRDAAAMTDILLERPGEFARRFDHALRVAAGDAQATEQLLVAFASSVPDFSTPVLLTLQSTLPTRTRRAMVRIFWPKGQVAKGMSSADKRATLSPDVVRTAVRNIETELLRRFADKPAFADFIIDTPLKGIVAPFNERTASRSAVQLPRGSQVQIPSGKTARLFLHWCEPETGGKTTDLDLSIGFYDSDWKYRGVCSYYELKFGDIATSAGDLQDAPFPNGATEFIDLDVDEALRHGIRYAVMVVNSYAGLPFSLLDRAFAGLMLRDDVQAQHFDPRTVELKFDLQGSKGIYLPFVLDIRENRLHWLDVYSRGQFEFNNVESSNSAITKICPELIEYFNSGMRISMYELALLHAAARGQNVFLRGDLNTLFVRKPGENHLAFLERLRSSGGDEIDASIPGPDGPSVFAALYRGDIDLATGSACYALFREKAVNTIAASDLIS